MNSTQILARVIADCSTDDILDIRSALAALEDGAYLAAIGADDQQAVDDAYDALMERAAH